MTNVVYSIRLLVLVLQCPLLMVRKCPSIIYGVIPMSSTGIGGNQTWVSLEWDTITQDLADCNTDLPHPTYKDSHLCAKLSIIWHSSASSTYQENRLWQAWLPYFGTCCLELGTWNVLHWQFLSVGLKLICFTWLIIAGNTEMISPVLPLPLKLHHMVEQKCEQKYAY